MFAFLSIFLACKYVFVIEHQYTVQLYIQRTLQEIVEVYYHFMIYVLTHDTSSFADRDASRKRMGLSQHVLTLIERSGGSGANFVSTSGQSRNTATGGGDSSETEEQCRQRCE